MKKQAEFGAGNHKVKFIWKGTRNEMYYVQYKATTRKGVARILRRFLKALKQLNTNIKTTPIHTALKYAVPFGYLWLAARSPTCEILTRDKLTNKPIKQRYSFTYIFPNAFSFSGIWQRLILNKNTLH